MLKYVLAAGASGKHEWSSCESSSDQPRAANSKKKMKNKRKVKRNVSETPPPITVTEPNPGPVAWKPK